LNPPATTDFAILFLPIEGLYAEVLRRPGLAEVLRRDFNVIVTGPTTIVALLNSLQMGFRTVAVQQRASEVWKTLGEVKMNSASSGISWRKPRKNWILPARTSMTPLASPAPLNADCAMCRNCQMPLRN